MFAIVSRKFPKINGTNLASGLICDKRLPIKLEKILLHYYKTGDSFVRD